MSAKICPFAGYDMPIQYPTGVIQEHEWVRSHAGLFDVSHMGQSLVEGNNTAAFFSRITPTSFAKTPLGRAKYTVLTNSHGGIMDDLIITRIREDKFFVVYNAARKEIDRAWMEKNLPLGVTFKSLDDQALLALQGPEAESALAGEIPEIDFGAMPYMAMLETKWKTIPVYVSRLGYTGEDGFEISIPATHASSLWKALLENPAVKAIGLAARDSLRLEMGYPLYGHDLTEETSPVEASLSWVMTKDHQGYFGAGKIVSELTSGPARKRVGIKLTESGIAREGAAIYCGEEKIGELTSGGFSPTLKVAIGQGYVKSGFAGEGTKVTMEVRGKKLGAMVHSLSFVPARTKSSSLTRDISPLTEKAV